MLGAGVLGAGVLGAGVLGAGVLGAGGVAAGLAFHISFTSASTFFGVEWTRMMVWVRPPLPTSSCPAFAWPVREELSLTSPAGASAGTSRKSSWPVGAALTSTALPSAVTSGWGRLPSSFTVAAVESITIGPTLVPASPACSGALKLRAGPADSCIPVLAGPSR